MHNSNTKQVKISDRPLAPKRPSLRSWSGPVRVSIDEQASSTRPTERSASALRCPRLSASDARARLSSMTLRESCLHTGLYLQAQDASTSQGLAHRICPSEEYVQYIASNCRCGRRRVCAQKAKRGPRLAALISPVKRSAAALDKAEHYGRGNEGGSRAAQGS